MNHALHLLHRGTKKPPKESLNVTNVELDFSCDKRYPIPRPLLSVVFTSQGGTFGEPGNATFGKEQRNTFRFLRQVWWISENAKRQNISIEIVVTDWPAPEEDAPQRERILDALKREKELIPDYVEQLRIIELPHTEFIQKTPKTLRVLEYFGKNIAARRALGRYILLGGTDSLPHEGIFSYIASQSGMTGCYGAFRQKIRTHFPPKPYNYDEFVQWRDDPETVKKWLPTGPPPSPYDPTAKPTHLVYPKRHWNAAGDFTLCTRPALALIRGYPEAAYRYHVDSALLKIASLCRVKLQVFHPSLSAFHQPHHQTLTERFEYPLGSIKKCPQQHERSKWGLPQRSFSEHLFTRGRRKLIEGGCVPPFLHLRGESDLAFPQK